MSGSIFDNLKESERARVPSAPAREVDEKLREAARRIEEQRRLIESMALTGRPTTEANFDLNRMYLLYAVLVQMRQRMGKMFNPAGRRSTGNEARALPEV